MKLEVVIPSKGRAGTIGKRSLAMFPDARVCVEAGEVQDYVDGGVARAALLPHPPLANLAAIRNWIIDHVDVDVLVMADDDVRSLINLVGWRARSYGAREVPAVLHGTAQCCSDAGAFLFGFAQNVNPMHFNPNKPFTLHEYVGGVTGLIRGHGLRYDERLPLHDDVDLSLQSLLKHRIVWMDYRWGFVAQRITNAGGLAEYRNSDRYEEEHRILKGKWGRWVGFSTLTTSYKRRRSGQKSAGTVMTKVRVVRRQHLTTPI